MLYAPDPGRQSCLFMQRTILERNVIQIMTATEKTKIQNEEKTRLDLFSYFFTEILDKNSSEAFIAKSKEATT